MGLKKYFILIGIGTFLAWLAWGVVVVGVDPEQSGLAGLVMFYGTLCIAIAGALTLSMSAIRLVLLKRPVIEREIKTAFRHAIFCSIAAILLLILSAARLFSPWYAVALVVVAAGIEFAALKKQG
ncbi:MAG: hypothetical protein WC477_01740 [Patescibacteria group bacterium]